MHRSRRVARRRRAVVLLLVAALGAATWFAVTAWARPTRGDAVTTTSSTTTSSTTTTSTSTTTTTTLPPGGFVRVGRYQVSTASLPIVEPSSGGAPPRTLPTAVWYPKAPGRRPLLVFSQGFRTAVQTYAALLADWASAGFVVAAPTYPHTNPPPNPTTPTTPTRTPTKAEDDIIHHPVDLQFVITTVLADAGRAGSVLHGRVDAGAIGLVGQSDGADVSLAVAANSAWYTPRVKAVAVLSGAEFNGFGGTYFTPSIPPVPLLVVQSSADVVNVPACSAQIYNGAPPPKYYLELLGVTHLHAYTVAGSYQTTVARVTTRFFDAELAGQRAALADLAAAGSVPDVSVLLPSTTAPPATGTCLDAP